MNGKFARPFMLVSVNFGMILCNLFNSNILQTKYVSWVKLYTALNTHKTFTTVLACQ